MMLFLYIVLLHSANMAITSAADPFQTFEHDGHCDKTLLDVVDSLLKTVAEQDQRISALEAAQIQAASLIEAKSSSTKSGSVVAFSAYNTESVITTKGQVLIFGGILSNFGDHYDPTTGMFTCPVDGLYIFSTSCGVESVEMNMRMFMEDTELGQAYANNWGQGSVTVITNCNQSQRVWVEAHGSGDVFRPGHWTTFSAVML